MARGGGEPGECCVEVVVVLDCLEERAGIKAGVLGVEGDVGGGEDLLQPPGAVASPAVGLLLDVVSGEVLGEGLGRAERDGDGAAVARDGGHVADAVVHSGPELGAAGAGQECGGELADLLAAVVEGGFQEGLVGEVGLLAEDLDEVAPSVAAVGAPGGGDERDGAGRVDADECAEDLAPLRERAGGPVLVEVGGDGGAGDQLAPLRTKGREPGTGRIEDASERRRDRGPVAIGVCEDLVCCS